MGKLGVATNRSVPPTIARKRVYCSCQNTFQTMPGCESWRAGGWRCPYHAMAKLAQLRLSLRALSSAPGILYAYKTHI